MVSSKPAIVSMSTTTQSGVLQPVEEEAVSAVSAGITVRPRMTSGSTRWPLDVKSSAMRNPPAFLYIAST